MKELTGVDLVIADYQDGDVTVITLAGDLDVTSAPALRAALDRHIRSRRLRLVLDLERVTFIDSAALGVIVGRMRLTRMSNGSMRIVCTVPRITRILTITGLERIFPVHESCEEAVEMCAADVSDSGD